MVMVLVRSGQDSGYILKEKLPGFADRLVVNLGRRNSKMTSRFFGLSNWKDGVAIY